MQIIYDIIIKNFSEVIIMKHIKKVNNIKKDKKVKGCGECATSCQSACKTSCTVGNQPCENK